MNLPEIRRRVLFSLEGKNISLTDLRGGTYPGIKILSVEEIHTRNYNTKVILKIDSWKISYENQRKPERYVERVIFYNRLNMSDILPQGLTIPINNMESVLRFFDSKGYDFTEDDIGISGGRLVVKPNSLGYYGEIGDQKYIGYSRLITEDRNHLIIGSDSGHIKTMEDGNE